MLVCIPPTLIFSKVYLGHSVLFISLLTCVCVAVQYMQYHGVEYEILALPTNEPNKSFNLVFQLAERLEAFKLNR